MLLRHHESSDKQNLPNRHRDPLQQHSHQDLRDCGGMGKKGVEEGRTKEEGDAKMEVYLKSVGILDLFSFDNCVPPNSDDSQK